MSCVGGWTVGFEQNFKLIFISVGELENDLNLSAEVFEKKHQVPKPDKDNSEIVFSCARGNRSRRAAEIAFKLNYKK